MHKRRLFALIPAAGRSRRMGRPKLLLPLGETTVIGRLLQTLLAADIETFVLIRPDDEQLRAEVARTSANIVQPEQPPPEMRVSVEHLLREVEAIHRPQPGDGWLLVPADHPLLSSETLRRLLQAWQAHPDCIVLPTSAGRRGHPTCFGWNFAGLVFDLPPETGVNQLLHTRPQAVVEVPVDDPLVALDLDTPDDYAQVLSLLKQAR